VNVPTPTGTANTTKDGWTIELTVVVPREQAATLDDAIDTVGERLKPLAWAGHIKAE
jgi:hypothetical protein